MLTEKDYCDYETCVALKELGYKVSTSAYYMPKNSQLIFVINQFRGGAAMDCFYSNNSLPKECMGSDFIDAPTMWEAQKWLREKEIMVYPQYLTNCQTWMCMVYEEKKMLMRSIGRGSYNEVLNEGIKEAVKLLKKK